MFPDFSERTVKIKHRNKTFIVPKLSILQYSQVIKIINQTDRQHNDDIIKNSRKKLWNVLESVLPKKILRARNIFNYTDLVELCIYLAFGSYLDNKIKDSKQYHELSSLPDYQFKAARILSQFSSYTLEKLLNEPASIFFTLSDYAERIRADNAIELIAEGIKAAFSNSEHLTAKRGSLTIANPNYTRADISLEYKHEIERFKNSASQF